MSYTILVPTDFSQTAEKAFAYALHIASAGSGTVYLYHVYSPLESPFIETVEFRQVFNLDNERQLMEQLHVLRAKWADQFPSVKIIVAVGRSPLVGSILEFARQQSIDMIVMGTQGASGLKKAVVGTIAARILDKTKLPLLLVPEKFEWQKPEKFVFATNVRHDDIEALRATWELAKSFDGFIEVVHLADKLEDTEKVQAAFDNYLLNLKVALPNIPLANSLLPVYGVPDALETLHEHVPYDMLVMVRHKKKLLDQIFLESCTEHMAYLMWKPLLVIPDQKA